MNIHMNILNIFKLFLFKKFTNVREQFEKVVQREQKWLLTGKMHRTKVDNYLAVIIHLNQCNICSYLKQINHR